MSLQQQPLGAYPGALSDNDWATLLRDNQEAQDLLSNAIAHHEHYRAEDDQGKRSSNHLHHKSDHYGRM